MSTTTIQLKLTKPELTDPADITTLNQNWDRIDQEIWYLKDDLYYNIPHIVNKSPVFPGEGWQWRKWSDGTAECWYSRTVNASIDSALDVIYSNTGAVSAVSYPFTFTDIPCETVHLTGDQGYVWLASNASNTPSQTGNYSLCSNGHKPSYNYKINYYVIGRWK